MATTKETVTQLYVGFYNRAPDPEGLNYWIGRINAGVSTADIANSFAASPEAIATYPFFAFPNVAGAEGFLKSAYKNLFGRDIDAGGLKYYSDKLVAKVPAGVVLAEILGNAATNTGSPDQKFLANKVAVGVNWADTAANKPGFVFNDGAKASAGSILAGVTAVDSTVTAANATTAAYFAGTSGAGEGSIFTLTNAADLLAPTSAVAANKTTEKDDTIRGLVDGDLGSTDVIDGGAGRDTLNAVFTPAGTTIAPVIKNVELINLDLTDATAGAADTATFDATNVTGAERISITKLGGAVGFIDTAALTNVAKTTEVSLSTANAFSAANVGFAAVTGAADAATIVGNGGTLGVLTVAGIEKLTVKGDAATTFSSIVAADADTITITGSKSVTVSAVTAANLTTVDSTAATASVSVKLTAVNDITVKGGATADTFDITGTAGKKVTIDAGAGADTITVYGKAATVTTGAGADTVKINVGTVGLNLLADDITTATKLAAAVTTITDFTAGTDKLQFSAGAIKVLTGTELNTVSTQTNILTATQKAIELAGAATVTEFQFGADTYVVYNAAGNSILDAGDVLVKLTGLADLPSTDLLA